MKKKLKLIVAMLIISSACFSTSVKAQGHPINGSFDKDQAIWWPLESADYNEAFKRAFLDIEAFITSAGATEIGNAWVLKDGKIILKETVTVTGAAQDSMWQMIAWYNNLSVNAPGYSEDYRRGLVDGSTTWGSMPLTWLP